MIRNLKKFSFVGTLLIVTGSPFFLSGCHSGDQSHDKAVQASKPAAPRYVVKIVTRPDDSGEFQRVYTYLEDGVTLVKLEIDYRDGRAEIQTLRPDGTIEQVSQMHPYTDKLKSLSKYASDGRTKIEEETYRLSGTRQSKTEFYNDSSSKTLRYRADGQRVYSEMHQNAEGKKQYVFFAEDGTSIWAKATEESNGDLHVETYRQNGNLDQVRDTFSDHKEITVFGDDGKAKFKQFWSGYRSTYSSYYSLDHVDEFTADGTTVQRRLEFNNWGDRYVTRATDLKDGKPSRVRTYRYDGTLENEDIYNADGTSKNVTHEASENIKEAFDPAMAVEPKFTDPLADITAN